MVDCIPDDIAFGICDVVCMVIPHDISLPDTTYTIQGPLSLEGGC